MNMHLALEYIMTPSDAPMLEWQNILNCLKQQTQQSTVKQAVTGCPVVQIQTASTVRLGL